MNKQGWLTRRADRIGGDGQDAASLAPARRSSLPEAVHA
jgi:N-acetylglucosaminyltransferase